MIPGTFIVTGAGMEKPLVALLTVTECAWLADGIRLAAKRESPRMLEAVYEQAFGKGAQYCYPATVAMLDHILSDGFNAPHREAVRIAASLLALGEPVTPAALAGRTDGGEGGTPARLSPPSPTQPPGGSANARPALVF